MPKKKPGDVVRTYPANLDAERCMLASIMLDKNVAIDMVPKLSERDFSEKKHKNIFESCAALLEDSVQIDLIVLADKLRKSGALDKIGGVQYLAELSQSIPSAAGYTYYFNILKRDSLLRSLLEMSKAIAEDVYTSDDADKSLSFAQTLVLDVVKQKGSRSLTHIREIVYDVINRIEKRYADPDSSKGLMTGFWNFDEKTGGLQRSDIILIAARPGIGKTAFALNIAANIAKRKENKKILVFSLEMSDIQLVQRMLCNIGNIDNDNVRRGSLEPNDFYTLRNAGTILAESGIYIDQTSEANPADIINKCRTFKLEHGQIDLIIVDYLQLMESVKKKENRQQEVSEISRRMKLLAKELDVPLILVSQMSRGAEIRGDKPQLHDLRDSGAIEQDADIVAFLYKDKNQPSDNEQLIELIISKFRNGRPGSLAFGWDGKSFAFYPESYDKIKALTSKSPPPDDSKSASGGKAKSASGGKAKSTSGSNTKSTKQEVDSDSDSDFDSASDSASASDSE